MYRRVSSLCNSIQLDYNTNILFLSALLQKECFLFPV